MTTRITTDNITDGTIAAADLSNLPNLVDWQSVVVADGSTNTTAVAGEGYFINTSSATHTINLPASPSLGDVVAIVDTGSAGSNNITIGRNGSNIEGAASDLTMSAGKDSRILVYSGSTNGWLVQSQVKGPTYISATGGTTTTSGDYKIHSFTSSGCFVVSTAGDQDTTIEYLVVAGGGSGGATCAGGGGGAGGYRTNYPSPDTGGLAISSGSYPVTVGAGGAATPGPTTSNLHGNNGSNSVFSTITSSGGGYGAGVSAPAPNTPNYGGTGGSGGGGNWAGNSGGAGNTPPVSPSQGNPGGNSSYPGNTTPDDNSGGGGGASAAGQPGNDGFRGGDGSPNSITGSAVTYAGGGGGSHRDNPVAYAGRPGGIGLGGAGGGGKGSIGRNAPDYQPNSSGTANTGGGGGGSNRTCGTPGLFKSSGAGGSGIVILRYKYQ